MIVAQMVELALLTQLPQVRILALPNFHQVISRVYRRMEYLQVKSVSWYWILEHKQASN